MIPTLSFDPASMSLWYDPTLISQNKEGNFMDTVMSAGLIGDINSALKGIAAAPNDYEIKRAIEFLSCIWHEQKHFFDFAFTSYGANRVRQYIEIYINHHNILDEYRDSNKVLGVPMDSSLDPIRKMVLGFDLSDDLEKIARSIKKRKNYLHMDNHVHTFNGKKYELGGEAQLEALAYLTQLTAIQTKIGKEAALLMQKMTPESLRPNQRYTWYIPLGQHFGLLKPNKIEEDIFHLDTSFILPIIYASLFCNYWRNDEVEFKYDVPSYRLLWLMKEISKDKEEYLKLDLNGKWNFVNKLVKAKWGKSVIEDFEYDLKREEKLLLQISQNDYVLPTVKECYADYHSLRKKIFEVFKKDPMSIIETERYVKEILHEVTPMPCFAYPHGSERKIEGTERVLGFELENVRCNWALIIENWEQIRGKYSYGSKNSWAKVISEYAPFAKLLINGRNHKTSLGPELLGIEKMLEARQSLKIKFDPIFEFPEERNAINYFYYITKREELVCDFCIKKIKAPDGFTLSPWTFRYSMKNANAAIERIGINKFHQDWSMWILCNHCYKDFRTNYDWRD